MTLLKRRGLPLACFIVAALACDEPAGPALPSLRIVTESLPRALLGLPYGQTFEATGGEPPYVWSRAPTSGPLPPGLTLASDGRLFGTPQVPASTISFTVRAESADGQSAQRSFTIRVPQLLRSDESCRDYPPWAVATFEDAELEELARLWVGVGEDQDLTCARLSAVTRAANGILEPTITSLAGMQNLTGLTSLSLGPDATLTFSDLSPLSGLTSLTRLTIGGASISEVSPLAGLTNLTELGLPGNDITDIAPLGGLTALRELRLSHNLISDIGPLAGLTNLEVLSIGRGAYSYVQRFGVPEVHGNPITDLSPLAGLTNLRQLWIHGQDVGSLDALTGLEKLENINAYNSGVTDLGGLAGLTSLFSLSLDGNAITDLTPLAGLTGLLGLGLRDNAISDVGPLAGLTSLGSLYLSDNELVEIAPLAGLSGVGYLYLSNNAIVDVAPLEDLIALSELTLDGNTALADIQPLIDNPGFGPPRTGTAPPHHDFADLRSTSVPCDQIAALEAQGAIVTSDCP
ncbi:MAG TPA: leucine-rich repeat domain-containing protein [Longimicrobiales bacterium]|nr:leucine-rich repeat domain-containing protein [Longimicrobiales bacterium]